ncbi:hypothetical protein, partial [Mammaliicoccus sciuri]|uniref:hypothetical protein n=1 Tax=Mammaliicoccus sciuri TaxID=1296 RepID=UPI0028A20EE0
DTIDGLKKFIRVLKNGGNLILVFPNQKKYEEVCNKRGQPLNPYHVHQEMGLAYMTNQLNKIENIKYDLIFKSDCEID